MFLHSALAVIADGRSSTSSIYLHERHARMPQLPEEKNQVPAEQHREWALFVLLQGGQVV